MAGKRSFNLMLIASAAGLVGLCGVSGFQPAEAQRKSIRLATSAVGSYGYAIAATMTRVIEDALGGEYAVTVQPYTSPTVAMKAVMDGNGEIAYTADIGMTELQTGTSGFKGYKPKMPPLGHTWYAYPMETMMATTAKFAGKFKCWKDFSGQPVFYTNAGFMNWLNMRRAYDVLGYKFNHVQIDLNANADALQRGTIVGSTTYTTSGRDLAAYWKETEIRTEIRVVNPCPDEVAKLKAAGLAVVDVDPKGAFTKPVGPSVLQGVPILFGYNTRLDMPEDITYRIISAFYRAGMSLRSRRQVFRRWRKTSSACRCKASAPTRTSRCMPASPGSSKSTRRGTTNGRSEAAVDRLTDAMETSEPWPPLPRRCSRVCAEYDHRRLAPP